jgi:hypothetical protein
MVSARAALLLVLFAATPLPLRGQLAVDLAAAWGDDGERTMDLGGGVWWWKLTLTGGIAAVEHGLEPGHYWEADRTEVYDQTDVRTDPRDARTTPYTRFWLRLEYQHSWWGLEGMWDPRNHLAGGPFVAVPISGDMEAQVEARFVKTLGWLAAARLRFR